MLPVSRISEIPMRSFLADSIARYKREQGYDVFFQTGTDEHGTEDRGEGRSGRRYSKGVCSAAAEIKRIWDLMNTSYDKFIRTTDEDHEAQVQKIFKKLYDQGDIYKGYYEGLYCTPCEILLHRIPAGGRQVP